MAYSSLREWLEYLKRQDILKEINRPVDLTYEVAALGKKADGKYALQFNSNGTSYSLVNGILSTRN